MWAVPAQMWAKPGADVCSPDADVGGLTISRMHSKIYENPTTNSSTINTTCYGRSFSTAAAYALRCMTGVCCLLLWPAGLSRYDAAVAAVEAVAIRGGNQQHRAGDCRSTYKDGHGPDVMCKLRPRLRWAIYPTSRDRSIMHCSCTHATSEAFCGYRRQHLPRYEERDQRPRKGGRREDQTEPRAFEFIIPESVHRSEGDAAFANALLCAHYRPRGCSTYCTQGLRIISGAVSLRGTPGTQVLMVPRPTTTRKRLNKTSRSCFTTKLCRVTIEVS